MHLTHMGSDPKILRRAQSCYDTSLPGQYGVTLPRETVWEENITDKIYTYQGGAAGRWAQVIFLSSVSGDVATTIWGSLGVL